MGRQAMKAPVAAALLVLGFASGVTSAIAQDRARVIHVPGMLAPVQVIVDDEPGMAQQRSHEVHVYRGLERAEEARTSYRVSTTIDYGNLAGILSLPGFDNGERVAEDGVCNPRCDTENRPASAFDDPTLRPGDMVVTEDGVKVYRGSRGATRRASDFQRAAAARLSASERRQIEAIDRASSYGRDQQRALAELDKGNGADLPDATVVASSTTTKRQ